MFDKATYVITEYDQTFWWLCVTAMAIRTYYIRTVLLLFCFMFAC